MDLLRYSLILSLLLLCLQATIPNIQCPSNQKLVNNPNFIPPKIYGQDKAQYKKHYDYALKNFNYQITQKQKDLLFTYIRQLEKKLNQCYIVETDSLNSYFNHYFQIGFRLLSIDMTKTLPFFLRFLARSLLSFYKKFAYQELSTKHLIRHQNGACICK